MSNSGRSFKLLVFCSLIALSLSLMLIVTSVLASFDHSSEHAGISRFATAPEVEWSRTFGSSLDDGGVSMQQTSDGGFIITGYRGPMVDADVLLIKTDESGSEEWSRIFGGPDSDCGLSVQQTSDGGFIIAGYTYSFGAGNADVYLIKTDGSGNEVWSRTFGGPGHDEGHSVQQTSNGGFVIAGQTEITLHGGSDFYLVKTDASGDEEWERTLGGGYAYSVQQTTDGGFIIVGGGNAYIVKTDASGDEEWSQTLGRSSYDECGSVQQASDGGFIIAGWTYSFVASDADVYLIKTDGWGNEVWSQTFGGSNSDEGYSLQQTSDGGFIIAGETESLGAGQADVYLIKTDVSGMEEWTKAVGGASDDCGYSVQQTSDGGFIIAGYTESYGAGGSDVYLIKIKEAATFTPTPTPPPTVTVTATPSPTVTLTLTPTPTPVAPPPPSNNNWIIGVIVGAVALIVLVPGLLWANRSIGRGRATNARMRRLKRQMESWRREGYDVSELEDLFK